MSAASMMGHGIGGWQQAGMNHRHQLGRPASMTAGYTPQQMQQMLQMQHTQMQQQQQHANNGFPNSPGRQQLQGPQLQKPAAAGLAQAQTQKVRRPSLQDMAILAESFTEQKKLSEDMKRKEIENAKLKQELARRPSLEALASARGPSFGSAANTSPTNFMAQQHMQQMQQMNQGMQSMQVHHRPMPMPMAQQQFRQHQQHSMMTRASSAPVLPVQQTQQTQQQTQQTQQHQPS